MSRGLKILALVTDAFGGYGGIAQYNRDLMQACAASDAVGRVVILPRIGTFEGGLAQLPKISQRPAHFGRASYILAALRLTLAEGPFDVIFCGHLYHTPLAVALARVTGGRLWLQTHGIEAWEKPSALIHGSIDRFDLVTTVSRYTRMRILEWSSLAPHKIRVVPNTVRPMFTPGPRDEALLAKYGLTDRKILLTVSRVDRADAYKGHARVIRALAEVRRAEPAAHYVIVGDGDGRAELEARVAAQGQGDAVTFLGRVSDDEVLALYRSSDVFVMPSTKEGFGIVFVEAAACGLPVIAGNRDGSVDALADGAFGRLIDPRSEAELVAALVETLRQGRAAAEARADEVTERFCQSHFTLEVDGLLRTISA